MPCWEVRLLSVEFHAENRDLLEEALRARGLTYRENVPGVLSLSNGMELDLNRGTATVQDYQQRELNQLKQAYSVAAIKKVAARNQWALQQNGPTQFAAVRT